MRSFFRLPCVQFCSQLSLLKDVNVRQLDYNDVVEWLHSGKANEGKELHCFTKFFGGDFSAFLERLTKVRQNSLPIVGL